MVFFQFFYFLKENFPVLQIMLPSGGGRGGELALLAKLGSKAAPRLTQDPPRLTQDVWRAGLVQVAKKGEAPSGNFFCFFSYFLQAVWGIRTGVFGNKSPLYSSYSPGDEKDLGRSS